MCRKVCFKCEIEKPLNEFYRHKKMADGHLNKCKDRTKMDVRTNYRKNSKHYREYDRKRAMRPDRIAMRRMYRTTPEGKLAVARSHKTYRNKYPERYAATNAVNNAIRDGKLTRPNHCEKCGIECRPHGHHDDYSKPLDVRWLCDPCHKEVHACDST